MFINLYLVSLVQYNGAIFDSGFSGAFTPEFVVTSFPVLAFGSRTFLALK